MADTLKNYESLLKDIQSRKFSPIYFLKGEEGYFIDAVSDKISELALNEAERSFNHVTYYGKDIDALNLMMAAKRYPMMAERQVIVLREAQNFNNKEFEKLIPYFENPTPSTILVFCYKNKTFDKRSKASKLLQKYCMFESEKLYERQVPAWIEKTLAAEGYTVDSKGASLLAEWLGNDLSRISNELDKIKINLKDTRHISIKDIQDNTGLNKDYNIFELQDAIAKRNFSKAIVIADYFAGDPRKNPIFVVIGNLYNYFSKVYSLHFLPDKSKSSVSQALGINPYFADDYLLALKNYNAPQLESIFGFLRDFDLRSKGVNDSGTPEGQLLKELLVRIFEARN